MSTTTVQTPEKELPTLSLWDYLGRRAGEALGAAVYEVAKLAKEPVKLRMLDEPYYKGKVMVYRHSFLKAVFNEPILKKIIDEDVKKYNKKHNKTTTQSSKTAQSKLPF
jgi:hypothetical protein